MSMLTCLDHGESAGKATNDDALRSWLRAALVHWTVAVVVEPVAGFRIHTVGRSSEISGHLQH